MKDTNRTSKTLLILAVLASIILPLFVKARFMQHILVMVVLYAVLGQAWNILGGYVGLVSIGQAAFFGLGSYVSSYLQVEYGINPWIGFALAGVITAVFGFLVGLPVTRLRGRYFAIATIALGQVMKVLFENWQRRAATGLMLPW